jgi:hypothetical protein
MCTSRLVSASGRRGHGRSAQASVVRVAGIEREAMARAGAAECAHGARPPGTRDTPARTLTCSQVRPDCNGLSHRPRSVDLHRLTLAAIDTTMSVGWDGKP